MKENTSPQEEQAEIKWAPHSSEAGEPEPIMSVSQNVGMDVAQAEKGVRLADDNPFNDVTATGVIKDAVDVFNNITGFKPEKQIEYNGTDPANFTVTDKTLTDNVFMQYYHGLVETAADVAEFVTGDQRQNDPRPSLENAQRLFLGMLTGTTSAAVNAISEQKDPTERAEQSAESAEFILDKNTPLGMTVLNSFGAVTRVSMPEVESVMNAHIDNMNDTDRMIYSSVNKVQKLTGQIGMPILMTALTGIPAHYVFGLDGAIQGDKGMPAHFQTGVGMLILVAGIGMSAFSSGREAKRVI